MEIFEPTALTILKTAMEYNAREERNGRSLFQKLKDDTRTK